MIILRPATAADQARIVAHIRAAQINPIALKWQHFVLALDETTGALAGTAQIKTHRDGSRELASVAVSPQWRGQGVARCLIEHLLAQNTGTLFLTCRSSLGPLYAKFGFQAVGESEVTPYFRRLMKVVGVLRPLMRRAGPDTLLVMKRDG
jgi:N-acetylglutamate synthase-like GNAT family acetyltransferase